MSPALQRLTDKWAEVKPTLKALMVRAASVDPTDGPALDQLLAEMDTTLQELRQVVPQ